jgi:protein gp37
MSTRTTIEWVTNLDGERGVTWNPVTGCRKLSPGCANCYAERVADRFWGARKFTEVRLHRDRIEQPLRFRKPQTVFVNSMGDLFHPDVPDEFIHL